MSGGREMELLEPYLYPTGIIDSDHPEIIAFAEEKRGDARDPVEKAVRLYYAVRDGIWYDPYYPFYLPEHYRASNVLRGGRGFCIPKASLLCAAGRASGIPARPSFADVRNHLATRQLLDFMGCDVFVYHAFVEFYLEGKWVKATPAFNKELCLRHHAAPLEFDGRSDSIFQSCTSDNRKFMEYLVFHGSFADIPVSNIVRSFEQTYGVDRVRNWIASFESVGSSRPRNFDQEDVLE
jgi:transglutaminase-like putative cysteine protease